MFQIHCFKVQTPMKSITRFLSLSMVIFGLACAAESPRLAIQGEISLSPSLASKLEPSDVVFVLALPVTAESEPASQPAESQAALPSPVAVKKITPAIFPMTYELTRDDVLFPDKEFKGRFQVIARVHKDGTLKTALKGDLEGASKRNPVPAGSKGVDILVDREK